MPNKWLLHLKSYWAKNKGKMSYRQAMSSAKKSYTPVSKAKGSKAVPKAPRKRRRRKKKVQ